MSRRGPLPGACGWDIGWSRFTGSTSQHTSAAPVLDLQTLWRLAAGWYAGRLERGYVRREPSAAADYLRSVGRSGTFWGLTSR